MCWNTFHLLQLPTACCFIPLLTGAGEQSKSVTLYMLYNVCMVLGVMSLCQIYLWFLYKQHRKNDGLHSLCNSDKIELQSSFRVPSVSCVSKVARAYNEGEEDLEINARSLYPPPLLWQGCCLFLACVASAAATLSRTGSLGGSVITMLNSHVLPRRRGV